MSDLTPAQHAQLGCEYLDELLHDLQMHDWCFSGSLHGSLMQRLSHTAIGIVGKVSEHANALGLPPTFVVDIKMVGDGHEQWLKIHDPVTGDNSETFIAFWHLPKNANPSVTPRPLDQRQFCEFAERMKREMRRRAAIAAMAAPSAMSETKPTDNDSSDIQKQQQNGAAPESLLDKFSSEKRISREALDRHYENIGHALAAARGIPAGDHQTSIIKTLTALSRFIGQFAQDGELLPRKDREGWIERISEARDSADVMLLSKELDPPTVASLKEIIHQLMQLRTSLYVDFGLMRAERTHAPASAAESNQVSNKANAVRRKVTGKRIKDKPLTAAQRDAVQMLLECQGNKTEAAQRLGISRASLDDRLKGAKLRGTLAKDRSVATRTLPVDRRGQINI